ncbi:MAG: EAL domain-containing protein, partial [Pseudorhodobacter sp.]|nr:EAL domain-containing protein [Frankiaceae bacterium]
LANRRYFLQQAQVALSRHGAGRCVVVMIDVDHFKRVNDQQGHQAGDAALQAVASHLQASVRPQDLLARFGGDEFVALLTDVTAEHALDVVTRIPDVRHLAGAAGKLSLSVGWALHGDTLDELLAHADVALYAAKAAGRGRAVAAHQRPDESAPLTVAPHAAVPPATGPYGPAAPVPHGATSTGAAPDGPAGVLAVPAPSVQIPAARSAGGRVVGGARALRHAIEHDQLTLHYQPKITAADGSVHGVEALVRWVHPQHGLRYPDAFLPQVEALGLMPALTDRVLAMALDQLRAWEADGLPALSAAVNLSGSGVSDLVLATRVQQALADRGLPGSRLIVEVTEQRLVEDLAGAGEALGELRRHGVRVSLDNFGSGVSSLTCLRDLPIDELKPDRALVAPVVDDARSAALVQGTIGFAHAVGLPMVAQGVEDLATAEQLTRFGCDVLQGYALARPMPAGQVAHWLHERAVLA